MRLLCGSSPTAGRMSVRVDVYMYRDQSGYVIIHHL